MEDEIIFIQWQIKLMLLPVEVGLDERGIIIIDRAGLERTEVGESAPSRLEDSPRPGRTKCELYETLQDLIMGAGKKHQSTRRAS